MVSLSANGITIEYETFGATTDPALLCILGLGMQMTRWPRSFFEALAAAGFYVVRFDNRDVGLSTKMDGAKSPPWDDIKAAVKAGKPVDVPYTLFDMAVDAVGLMDGLDIASAHILGASLGGRVAQIVAAKWPDRAKSLISIMSSSDDPSLPSATPQAEAARRKRPKSKSREDIIENFIDSQHVMQGAKYKRTEDELRSLGEADYDRSYYPAGFIRQQAANLACGSRVELLEKLSLPCLVIHGTDDPLIPLPCGEHTAQCIEGAQLEVIEGMGHDLPESLVPRLSELVIGHLRRCHAV